MHQVHLERELRQTCKAPGLPDPCMINDNNNNKDNNNTNVSLGRALMTTNNQGGHRMPTPTETYAMSLWYSVRTLLFSGFVLSIYMNEYFEHQVRLPSPKLHRLPACANSNTTKKCAPFIRRN